MPPWLSPFLPPWCLPGASQAVQMVLSCLPGVQSVLSCPPGASLVPRRLSNWSFPASLVPPWCLPGCPNGPFLPETRRDLPLLRAYPPLSKFQWRPARFVPNPGVGPTAGFPYRKTERPWHRIAFRRLFVAQTLLLRPQRFVLARAGHPTRKPKTGLLFFSCARPQRLPTVGVAVSLRFVAVASALEGVF